MRRRDRSSRTRRPRFDESASSGRRGRDRGRLLVRLRIRPELIPLHEMAWPVPVGGGPYESNDPGGGENAPGCFVGIRDRVEPGYGVGSRDGHLGRTIPRGSALCGTVPRLSVAGRPHEGAVLRALPRGWRTAGLRAFRVVAPSVPEGRGGTCTGSSRNNLWLAGAASAGRKPRWRRGWIR